MLLLTQFELLKFTYQCSKILNVVKFNCLYDKFKMGLNFKNVKYKANITLYLKTLSENNVQRK